MRSTALEDHSPAEPLALGTGSCFLLIRSAEVAGGGPLGSMPRIVVHQGWAQELAAELAQ